VFRLAGRQKIPRPCERTCRLMTVVRRRRLAQLDQDGCWWTVGVVAGVTVGVAAGVIVGVVVGVAVRQRSVVVNNTQSFHLTNDANRWLLQKHPKCMNDPVKGRPFLRNMIPTSRVNFFIERIGAFNWALSATSDDILRKRGCCSVLDVVRGEDLFKWRSTARDFPQDHSQRIDIAFDCVPHVVL
jgi:hypothetical protein